MTNVVTSICLGLRFSEETVIEIRRVRSIPQAATGKTPLVKSNLPRTP